MRRVLALARDLVDLVDVDDAALRLLDVVVGGLQQVDDDVLDVLADVAGLGQGGGVGDGEGHVEDAASVWASSVLPEPVGPSSRMFDFCSSTSSSADLGVDALVVVVDGDGEDLLGPLLADHVLVEDGLDLGRLGHRRQAVALRLVLDLLGDDVVAQPDALVADVDRRSGDELLDLLLALAAEGATTDSRGYRRLRLSALAYLSSATLDRPTRLLSVFLLAVTSISSMMPYSLASAALMK